MIAKMNKKKKCDSHIWLLQWYDKRVVVRDMNGAIGVGTQRTLWGAVIPQSAPRDANHTLAPTHIPLVKC